MFIPCVAFISPGGSEFLLIMLVLILLFGAKDAPRIFRSIHDALDKMQRAAASFRYKMMYGDLHAGTSDDEPYDVEADPLDDDEEFDGFRCEAEEAEEQKSASAPSADTGTAADGPETQDREQDAPNPAADSPDPETRNT